jgi:hypothetical protein
MQILRFPNPQIMTVKRREYDLDHLLRAALVA